MSGLFRYSLQQGAILRQYSLILAIYLVGNGCAPAGGEAPRTASDGNEVVVPRTIVTPHDARDIPELLRDAAQLAEKRRFREAAEAYDRIVALDATGPSASDALWGAAECYDHNDDHELALDRYQLFADQQPTTAKGAAARVRATRLLVFLARYEHAGQNADELLGKLELLNDFAKISVFSAKALSLLSRDQDVKAAYYIEKARDLVEQNRLDEQQPMSRDLAPLYYALGESRRIRAERIKFDPLPRDFGAVLEARCQLLLDAQSAYADSMRANDSHWSASAGYRIVELYQRLHEELNAIPIPPSARTERERALYQGALRIRYAVLLTKAKTMAEHTVSMATRTGESSEAVTRTKAALAAIDRAIAAENAALDKLPYTRADFEAYISEMEAAATTPPSKTTKPVGKPKP